MAIKFNIDVSKLTSLMDEADGKVDGKINKKVWNQFNPIFETAKVKNYKEVKDANNIVYKYFSKISNDKNPQSYAAAQLVYNQLMEKAMILAADNKIEKITEQLRQINKEL